MIGVIGALELETMALVREMEQKETRVISGVTFVKGKWCGRETVVATCGVGKVFAALCAEAMILHYQPSLIINSGIAGALAPELHILDVAIADQVVQHDMDTSPLGDPPGLLSGIDRVYLPADKKAADALERAARTLGVSVLRGAVASGDQFIASKARKAEIRRQFQAICCEMEGASIGQVCFVNQVPFAVLRTISDGAADEAKLDYPVFAARAAEQCHRILKQVWEDLDA